MRSTRSSRLSAYADTASARPIVGGSAMAGMTIAAVASPAVAGLQVWSVGVALPQIGNNDPASMDLQLNATFNAAFQINFFGTGPEDDQCFWAPNDNLSLINYDEGNDPAIWLTTFTADAAAMNGVASADGSANHSWYQAHAAHYTYNDIHEQIGIGETGAFGIRFIDGSDYYYGWVEVSMDADEIITVKRWALQDTANTAAQYTPGGGGGGAVPGLGGLAALAMGAGGVRRKRQRIA